MLQPLTFENKVILTGALAVFITAIFSVGMYNYDEYFEVLDYVILKNGGDAARTWEYDAQISNGLLPLVASSVDGVLRSIDMFTPFRVTFLLRLIAGALGFLASWKLFFALKGELEDPHCRRLFLLLSFLLWFLVFQHVRFSSEGVSGSLFALGLAMHLAPSGRSEIRVVVQLIAGFLFGLAIMIRFPVAVMFAGFIGWLIIFGHTKLWSLALILSGALAGAAAGVMSDVWLYGEFVFTPLEYFHVNILQDTATQWGDEPWWYYIWKVIELGVPPFSLIYVIAFALLIIRVRSVFLWCTAPLIIVLTVVDYKMISMLIPLFPLVPFIVASAVDEHRDLWRRSVPRRLRRFAWVSFWSVHLALLVVIVFYPATDEVYMYRRIYHHYDVPISLYYTGDKSPYDLGIGMKYFHRESLSVSHISSVEDIPLRSEQVLLALEHKVPPLTGWHVRLVYRSLPEWVTRINIGNWVDRTKIWRVYELQQEIIE